LTLPELGVTGENITQAMPAAPTATPAPAMPPNLHHFAVIGHDARRKRCDWRGLRSPDNGHQDQAGNRHR
jgi:hypothetical protein